MIYDKLCHLTRYRGISASLDCAIDFLLTADLSSLASGRGCRLRESFFLYDRAILPGKPF